MPELHFPLVNMAYALMVLPLAAHWSRRNPCADLSVIGLWLVNGLIHIIQTTAMGVPYQSPGFFTGVCFVLIFAWACWAVFAKCWLVSRKGFVIAVVSGVVLHIALFSAYTLHRAAGRA